VPFLQANKSSDTPSNTQFVTVLAADAPIPYAVGNLLIATFGARVNTAPVTVSAGWQTEIAATATPSYGVYTRIADGTSGDDITVTWTSGNATGVILVGEYTEVDSVDYIEAGSYDYESATVKSVTTPDITPLTPDGDVVSILVARIGSAWYPALSANGVENAAVAATSTQAASVTYASWERASVDPLNDTWTTVASGNRVFAAVMVLKKGGVTPPPPSGGGIYLGADQLSMDPAVFSAVYVGATQVWPGGGDPIRVEATDQVTDLGYQGTLSVKTFPDVALGAEPQAGNTRTIVLTLGTNVGTSRAKALSGITIGGVPATIRQENDTYNGFGDSLVITATADVPTGTIADVVFTFSASTDYYGFALAVYASYGMNTFVSSDMSTGNNGTASKNVTLGISGLNRFAAFGIAIGLQNNFVGTMSSTRYTMDNVISQDMDVNDYAVASWESDLDGPTADDVVNYTIPNGTSWFTVLVLGDSL
jgi:hypothetical protein